MVYKNVGTSFFRFVTTFVGRTDGRKVLCITYSRTVKTKFINPHVGNGILHPYAGNGG